MNRTNILAGLGGLTSRPATVLVPGGTVSPPITSVAPPAPILIAADTPDPVLPQWTNPVTTPTYTYGPPNPPTYAQNTSPLGPIIAAGASYCDSISDPRLKAVCLAAAGIATTYIGNKATDVVTGSLAGGQCPTGYIWSSTFNACIRPQAALPGGQPLTLSGTGVATQGGLGLQAITPTQVGTITRNDGTQGPIFRCPGRYVLGMDYLCYPKNMIPNNLRAHPRGTRPLLTGGDVKILRRARSLEKKVSKLSSKYGKKVCHCGPKTKRKK